MTFQRQECTSSRVVPGSSVDLLSDYDIELYVSDLVPFELSDEWLGFLGKIMVRWPFKPRSTMKPDWNTRLVLFENKIRVDFQITANLDVPPSAYANDRKVLIDKDNLFGHLQEPKYTDFCIP